MNQQVLLNTFVSRFNAQKEVKNDTKYRLRCPICNDHPTRECKKSAGLYMQKGQYMFQCFRCKSHMSLIEFAKREMPAEYNALSVEFSRRRVEQKYLEMKEQNPFQE